MSTKTEKNPRGKASPSVPERRRRDSVMNDLACPGWLYCQTNSHDPCKPWCPLQRLDKRDDSPCASSWTRPSPIKPLPTLPGGDSGTRLRWIRDRFIFIRLRSTNIYQAVWTLDSHDHNSGDCLVKGERRRRCRGDWRSLVVCCYICSVLFWLPGIVPWNMMVPSATEQVCRSLACLKV